MFENKIIERLDKMLDSAMNGTFVESDYDETRLSRLESKWKEFLGSSVLSNKNLEAERHRLEQFISDISHQTKTPMTNIKMYTELLCEEIAQLKDSSPDREKAAYERISKYADEIKRQDQRLEFLIASLTKLSRLESGTLEVVAKTSLLTELTDSAIAAVRPKADIKKISISVTGCDKDMTASFDMKWTLEALVNVLDNAVKYSPPGGKIEIDITSTEMYVAIHVCDEGAGISEEDAAKIFGRFYRSNEVQQEEGVGIGLYLAREILSKEDGYIKVVTNEQRSGGEFILYLRK
ncbi:MAG: HAMP domain-containing histidine kinase [Lachnospiraceae bacterium]|nr:HAMP domain-containing histidine kinase [Lachnospiraceae bacterium]